MYVEIHPTFMKWMGWPGYVDYCPGYRPFDGNGLLEKARVIHYLSKRSKEQEHTHYFVSHEISRTGRKLQEQKVSKDKSGFGGPGRVDVHCLQRWPLDSLAFGPVFCSLTCVAPSWPLPSSHVRFSLCACLRSNSPLSKDTIPTGLGEPDLLKSTWILTTLSTVTISKQG